MNVSCTKIGPRNIQKKIFTLSPVQKDGLLIKIHNTTPKYSPTKKRNIQKRIRFTNTVFDTSGKILASVDIEGNIFIIDFLVQKFWLLPKLSLCTSLRFSSHVVDELVVGLDDGSVVVINVNSGYILAKWEDHTKAIKNISFMNNLCLTASCQDAIIYSLCTYKKLHALNLKTTRLKKVSFVPKRNFILACFDDYYIHVWDIDNFSSIKQIMPATWKKKSINALAFSKDGRFMALGCHIGFIFIYSFDLWTVTRSITLTTDIVEIKKLEFQTQVNNEFANNLLAILSGQGTIYFYDLDTQSIVTSVRQECDIICFESNYIGDLISLVLHSGEVLVYKAPLLLTRDAKTKPEEVKSAKTPSRPKLHLPKEKTSSGILTKNRLKAILMEYWEYPTAYRNIIWATMLKLPKNRTCYAALNNEKSNWFPNIEEDYPLMNKLALKNLKKLLTNLANWCPFFGQVKFLPLFVFPFLKIFENDPVQCFEAVMTIIINWCQHWFQYSPFPPVNILALLENIFLQYDSELLTHLIDCRVTSHLYAWSLLEVAFSEVLTVKEWCIFWDHVISNEPSFLLLAVISYNVIHRNSLLSLKDQKDFELFYHSQNPLSFKLFIRKTYHFLNNITEDIHPRQYLKEFEPLSTGAYPIFVDFPDFSKMYFEPEEDSVANDIKSKIMEEEQKKAQLEAMIKAEEERRMKKVEELYKRKTSGNKQVHACRPTDEEVSGKKRYSSSLKIKSREEYLEDLQLRIEETKKIFLEMKEIEVEITKNFEKIMAHKSQVAKIKPSLLLDPKKKLEKILNEQKKLKAQYAALQKELKKMVKMLKTPSKKQPEHKEMNKKILKLEESTRDLEKEVDSLLKRWSKKRVKPMNTSNSSDAKKSDRKTTGGRPPKKRKSIRKDVRAEC